MKNQLDATFRFLWPCIMNVGWRERNQQDATNPIFIIKLLSQHVSGIIMPIIRRTRPRTTAYGVLHWLCWLWLPLVVWSYVVGCVHCRTVTFPQYTQFHTTTANHNQCRTPFAVVHGLVLLMMGIMMPETGYDSSLIINIGLVAPCWFLSLHPRCHLLFYSASYRLNMLWALLCPSSGARDYVVDYHIGHFVL